MASSLVCFLEEEEEEEGKITPGQAALSLPMAAGFGADEDDTFLPPDKHTHNTQISIQKMQEKSYK